MSNVTKRDLENAKLAADIEYNKFMAEFEAEYNQPDEDLKNSMAFKSMSEAQKQTMKQTDPEVYKLAVQKYGGA